MFIHVSMINIVYILHIRSIIIICMYILLYTLYYYIHYIIIVYNGYMCICMYVCIYSIG